MKKNNTIEYWISYLISHGVSLDIIEEYTPYITNLVDKNLPVIFELEHLSLLIGIKYLELLKMIHSPDSFYREFDIPKKKGGVRHIVSPYPSLLSCQKWIYNNILKKISIHPAAHGFNLNHSIVTNAQSHLNKKCLLQMDVKDFFPSLPINWVINLFSSLGYSHNVSFNLASLCCLNDKLPQGAATSPYLSNILLVGLDKRLSLLSTSYQLTYTRYADDLCFSGEYIPHELIQTIESIIIDYNLTPNKNKTRLQLNNNKRIVTGISVSGPKATIPRQLKRELKQELYYIQKHGYLSHVTKMKISNPKCLQSLEGKFSFWLQVEPDNDFAKKSLMFLIKLRKENT